MKTNTKRVVMIGSSQGGLGAVSTLLSLLKPTLAYPIIIVQHRSKTDKELLEEILQSKTTLKLKQADEKEMLKPGVIYTAPPDYHLLLEKDRTFSLSGDQHVNYSRPSIDVLFESGADSIGLNIVAAILTGASKDGSKGIEKVKESGGLTIAQDPSEASSPLMPESAIKTKKVDHILTIREIANFINNL